MRLAAAIENLHAEELRLDEKQRELDAVQAAYDEMMQQWQVRMRLLLLTTSGIVLLQSVAALNR